MSTVVADPVATAAADPNAGIPQVNVFTPDGQFVGRADEYWDKEGIIGEADRLEKYLLDGADESSVLRRLELERVRQGGFTELGLKVIRWVPHEAIDGSESYTRFRYAAATPGPRVTAQLICSCCTRPVAECAVQEFLTQWRRQLAEEFAPKV